MQEGVRVHFKHDWCAVEKSGRCYNCRSTQHTKKDCGVKARKPGDAGKSIKGGVWGKARRWV